MHHQSVDAYAWYKTGPYRCMDHTRWEGVSQVIKFEQVHVVERSPCGRVRLPEGVFPELQLSKMSKLAKLAWPKLWWDLNPGPMIISLMLYQIGQLSFLYYLCLK